MSNILAADDSEPIRKMVSMALTSAGHQVTTACDGEEALRKFKEGHFDLLVTDINMPVMNGFELIAAVRTIDADVPILALTTEVEADMRNRGANAGANGWIVKPFKTAQFLDLVRQIIE